MAHVLDAVFDEAVRLSVLAEGRHQEIVRNFVPKDRLNAMEQKIQSIDSAVQGYQQQFISLQKLVRDSHSRLTVGLPQHMSESMLPIFLTGCDTPLTSINSHDHKIPSHRVPPVHRHILSASPCRILRGLQKAESKRTQEIPVIYNMIKRRVEKPHL